MGSILEWGVESYFKTKYDMSEAIISRIREFMDDEARSCSMDFGCITPLYVYRMWGGVVPLNEIEDAFKFQDSCYNNS